LKRRRHELSERSWKMDVERGREWSKKRREEKRMVFVKVEE
jgi:hypothetical protein